MSYIEKKLFSEIDINDNFFDTLKEDYKEFTSWYSKKSNNKDSAFVLYEADKLLAFLYLKVEKDEIDSIPKLEAKRRLKVGTFKVEAHGTKLGERFIKRIFDTAIEMKINEIYLTIFEKHNSLIHIFEKFGFYKYAKKTSPNGTENVLIKQFDNIQNDILKDYPMVQIDNKPKYGLSIYPKYHTQLFSDSILNNESVDILKDRSHTNSIHKIYICAMDGVTRFQRGDNILIYRTKDDKGSARYRSVITSLCIIEEVKDMRTFENEDDYLKYCGAYSIFSQADLKGFYRTKKYPYIIKMTYNIAFKKRVTNGDLVDEIGLNPNYWGVFEIDNQQFKNILKAGEVDESLIIN